MVPRVFSSGLQAQTEVATTQDSGFCLKQLKFITYTYIIIYSLHCNARASMAPFRPEGGRRRFILVLYNCDSEEVERKDATESSRCRKTSKK